MAAALTQAELRAAARAKFARADEMLFTRAGLEQASAEPVAHHRAARFPPGLRLADLCCGVGGDLVALAAAHEVVGVDRDPLHAAMAAHNAGVYGAGPTVRVADVREVDLAGFDGAFVDPARRDARGRTGRVRTEPALEWCLALADTVARVAVKAAPGLPRDVVPPGWEVEFVAVGRDLKEAVLWSPALAGAATRATVLPGPHTLLSVDGLPVPVAAPGEYLLDPNPAVTRAGLVVELARAVGAWKIDERVAFLSCSRAVATPFARCLRVVASLPWRLRDIADAVRAHDVGAVDIRRRGLAGDVEAIRRRLPLSGPVRATLVMTRVDDHPWALLCTGVEERPGP